MLITALVEVAGQLAALALVITGIVVAAHLPGSPAARDFARWRAHRNHRRALRRAERVLGGHR